MTPTELLDWTMTQFPHLFATPTVRGYRNLASRMESWCQLLGQPPSWDHKIWTTFITAIETSPQAKHQYSKVASAIISLRQKVLNNSLSLQRRSLLAAGAATPIAQARPAPRSLLDIPALQDLRLPLMVAWKTAARWDELTRVTVANFIHVAADEVVLDWDVNTKASRVNPFRASRYSVIRGSLTDEIALRLQQLPQTAPLTSLSTAAATQLIKAAAPGYSASSLKAGAVDAATRALLESQLAPSDRELLLSRFARHQHKLDPSLTTLRYIRDELSLARLLRTGEVSVLL